MSTKLALEFSRGYEWLNDVDTPCKNPFAELMDTFKKVFQRIFK